jgi:hypothetical protein
VKSLLYDKYAKESQIVPEGQELEGMDFNEAVVELEKFCKKAGVPFPKDATLSEISKLINMANVSSEMRKSMFDAFNREAERLVALDAENKKKW